MDIIAEEEVPVVFTSAGSPKKWTGWLHKHGVKVAHVVSSSLFAKKSEDAGVDAVVAEGFEAGGHNGREETSTLCLIPAVRKATELPVLAAGGIATGAAWLAVQVLGAEGIQMGTRFALTAESSANEHFKTLCLNLQECDTKLLLKKLSPTRLAKGGFRTLIEDAEARGADKDELLEIIGKGKSRLGIFDGDLTNGELEIGQVTGLLQGKPVQTVADVFDEMISEYKEAKAALS